MPYARCVTPLLDPSTEVTRLLKWQPYEEMSYVNWCRRKEFIPIRMRDGRLGSGRKSHQNPHVRFWRTLK